METDFGLMYFKDLKFHYSHKLRMSWEHVPYAAGVYRIVNTFTGKSYVGATQNLHQRIPSHYVRLKGNRHKKKEMQSDYNEYGEYFAYEILLLTEDYERMEVELYPQYSHNTYNKRITPDSGKGLRLEGEALERMALGVSKALKGRTPKNIEFMRSRQRREILEFEDGEFVCEYPSCREAGRVLGVSYKRLNRIVVRNSRGEKVTPLAEYPTRTWTYKDGEPVRIVNRRKDES